MIKLVAFDWNGIILADTYACLKADNYMIASLGGKPVTLSTFRERFTVPVIDYYVSVLIPHSPTVTIQLAASKPPNRIILSTITNNLSPSSKA